MIPWRFFGVIERAASFDFLVVVIVYLLQLATVVVEL
jgi:hypothetical protein